CEDQVARISFQRRSLAAFPCVVSCENCTDKILIRLLPSRACVYNSTVSKNPCQCYQHRQGQNISRRLSLNAVLSKRILAEPPQEEKAVRSCCVPFARAEPGASVGTGTVRSATAAMT